MAGWSRQKRLKVERAFYLYLDACVINSKDLGPINLGEHLYEGQRRVITQIFDALEADIRNIWILKSRQLGISTIIRALVIFLLGVHHGLKGAIVFDTDPNKAEAHAEMVTMIGDLPPTLGFPAIKRDNVRLGTTLANDSKLLFMSAGVKKTKGSGTLGRSVGITIAHLSELCSYDNDEGLEAFRNSLSEVHENRLYIYESTARGPNRWKQMWDDARLDPDHNCCIFLGWWCKQSQAIAKTDRDFQKYGVYDVSERELEKIRAVKEKYNHDITIEQLSWIRKHMDPSLQSTGVDDIDYEGNPLRIQEQPWTEDEAFQQTGSIFFSAPRLTEQTNNNVSHKWTGYVFNIADEFDSLIVAHAGNHKSVELKVWEPPERGAVYVMGIDTAYGENDKNDSSSFQVLRCFADGIDQVAEYNWPLITTQQYAWVIAATMGWYASEGSEIRYILELNGPGTSVYTELRTLRQRIDAGYRRAEVAEKGLQNIFANVRTFVYSRPDSFGPGHNFHWKTQVQNKVPLMEDLRNFVSNGLLRVRSLSAIEEMKNVSRDGDSIGAQGSMHDDRVFSLGLSCYYWKNAIRQALISGRRTREAEAAKKRLSITDQVYLFQQSMMSDFMARKQTVRRQQAQAARNWRSGARRY
jgi:hypothetical protein